jgi:hypothetical protein
MERLRTPSPSEGSSVDTVHPLPNAAALRELLETVSSPGVLLEDVDLLIRTLARPLSESESPRARADLLLSVLETREAVDLKGSDGRTVRDAAVEALLNLGYPYALEVPPEALAQVQRAHADSGPRDIPRVGIAAASISLIAQTIPFLPAMLEALTESHRELNLFDLIFFGALWGPSLSALLGGWLRSRGLQRLGLITMALVGSVWLTVFALSAATGFHDLTKAISSLVAGLSLLVGAVLLRSPEWLPRQDASPNAPASQDSAADPE